MKRYKEHCDYYVRQIEPVYHLQIGDCIKPANGRWQPHACESVCKKYSVTAYLLKTTLVATK